LTTPLKDNSKKQLLLVTQRNGLFLAYATLQQSASSSPSQYTKKQNDAPKNNRYLTHAFTQAQQKKKKA
jgi:hypothetical protein